MEVVMNTNVTKSTTGSSTWMHFLGAMLIVALMVPVAALSAPTVPVLTSPADVAHPCVSTTPTLSWNPSTGGVGTVHYELQVSLNAGFASTVYDVATLTDPFQIVPATGFLTNATIYFWRVQAIDDNGPSGYSSARSFTTSPLPVNLGSTAHFAILAKTGISATGTAGTAIVGDIGVSPAAATYITGFSLTMDASGTYSTSTLVASPGKVYAADYGTPAATNMTTAVGDMLTAYGDAAGRTGTDYTELYAGNLTGHTLAPGLYKWGTGVSVDAAGGVTLSGSATDVWIFQIAQDLTVGNGAIITLGGNAQASNIFWQVAGQVTLGTTVQMKGDILCYTLIAMNTGAILSGRALAQTAVTLDANPVTRPSILTVHTNPATVDLSTAANFRILAGSAITIGAGSTVPGNIGLSPSAGSNVTGAGLTGVTGIIYTIDGSGGSTSDAPGLATAKGNLSTAYGVARDRTADATVGPQLGGTTLGCGVYKSTSGIFDITGTLTLSGTATDVFIFQTDATSGTLTTAANSHVVLIGGALASNVFWQVGNAATLGATSVFKGTIMAEQSISVGTGTTLDGKALASAGSVTLEANTATVSVFNNPATVNLLTAANFRILAGDAITINSGCTVTGDIGESPGTTFTNNAGYAGVTHFGTGSTAFQAQTDLSAAYSNASGRTADATVGTELGGTTLGCGVYNSASGTFGITGTLTLNGTANDVFIFKTTTTLITGASSHVTLTGGAVWSNVFWQVGGSATIEGAFRGNILALTAITQTTGTVDGRLLARTAAVTVSGTSVLPVELVSFTATANRMNADLRWSTATEANNYGFEIERRQTADWTKVGFIAGAGISNSPRDYSYTDNNLTAGRYTYRLKQVDNNGAFSYHGSVEVEIAQAPQAFALLQNYPNPFNPSTRIEYSLAKAAQVSLKVYNMLGNEIATLVNSRQEAGSYTVPFNTMGTLNLSSGVYLYRLEAGSYVSTKKLILMK